MNLAGKKVSHAIFGEGLIVEHVDSYVRVKFPEIKELKEFSYPDCFQNYLKLSDKKAASFVCSDIEIHKKNRDIVKQKQEKISEEKTRRVIHQNYQKHSRRNADKDRVIRPYGSVNQFCMEFNQYLSVESDYLKNKGGKHFRIFDGRLIENGNGHYVYSFESDSEMNYPDGTQITIWHNDKGIDAVIDICDGFTLIISTLAFLGERLTAVEFSAEPWKLISSLMERLEDIEKGSRKDIVQALICDGYKKIQHGGKLVKGQTEALKMAESQPITFIWGPPGTGKTETLAKIVIEHIEKKQRVLILSYSNVSVDGALLRVHTLEKRHTAGKILRYGYPKSKELLNHEYLTSYNYALRGYPELRKERSELILAQQKESRTTARYVAIGERLSEIRSLLSQEEKEAVRKAKFVATTVSKAIVDKAIYLGDFDTVIFDEASMAYIPQIIFAASLAKKHFICMGDFAQLPPIVQSGAESRLNADIFQYCGITYAVENGDSHEWLCLLDTQYRMHPQIAAFSSANIYHSLLKSAEGMKERRNSIASSLPLSNEPLGLMDISGMMSVCTKTADSSRINPLSAFISFGLALQAASNHDVGIITPYNAQARLLHAMSRDASEQYPDMKLIACATVHQFQGSEKDVILYDAVDCYRQQYPGTLITSMENNYANRLFNVALTRAKGKFVAVTNVSYMDNKNLSSDLMFSKLIHSRKNANACMDGRHVIKGGLSSNYECLQWYTRSNGISEYVYDLSSAKKEIRIDAPDDMGLDQDYINVLSEALENAKQKGTAVLIRTVDKDILPKEFRKYAIANKYIYNPITVIDKQLTWFGAPGSKASFISEGRTLETAYRPWIRFFGKYTAVSMYGFMELNKVVDQDEKAVSAEGEGNGETFAQYVRLNMKCPKCGSPLKLIDNKGKFFLGCTNYPSCKSSQSITVDMVEDYFASLGSEGKHCQRDHYSLEAKSGPYGVYVQCCGYEHHKYRLNEI